MLARERKRTLCYVSHCLQQDRAKRKHDQHNDDHGKQGQSQRRWRSSAYAHGKRAHAIIPPGISRRADRPGEVLPQFLVACVVDESLPTEPRRWLARDYLRAKATFD